MPRDTDIVMIHDPQNKNYHAAFSETEAVAILCNLHLRGV